MSVLTPIPWQLGLLVHPDLLAKLEQVRARLGRPPLLYGPLSGWRSYAEQEALWDAYRSGKGNVASNPDTGNRTHMRGVAADLQDKSDAMQSACRAVGLQRDRSENWHWQLPNWRNYPIIPTNESDEEVKTVEGFYAVVDGVPSWMWINWATGRVFSVHTQAEADHIGSYMGSVTVLTDSPTATAGEKYKSLIVMAQNLLGPVKPDGSHPAITPQQIAQAVDAALEDDFAAVRADVNKPRTLQ